MKKYQNAFGIIFPGLFITILSAGDLYFYRPPIFDSLPKILFIPFCLILGICASFLLLRFRQKVKNRFSALNWPRFLLILFAITFLVYCFNEFYFISPIPNAFSETRVNIKAPAVGNLEEVNISSIRVDYRKFKQWKDNCQITGPFRWDRYGTLTLENTAATRGEIACQFYPTKSIEIVFPKDSIPENTQILVGGKQIAAPSVITDSRGDIVRLDISFTLKGIVPQILIFLNILFLISLLGAVWIAFQLAGIKGLLDYNSLVWTLSAYLICYVLFFIFPIYFNDQHTMIISQEFISFTPIGMDFKSVFDMTQSVFLHGRPLEPTYYSPGSFYLFIPLAWLGYDSAYKIYTLIKLTLFILATFFIPLAIISKKGIYIPLFFLLTGLMSFGWKFEVERGQGYSFVFALLFISIWVFHKFYTNRYARYFAYLLFIIAIQMKLMPVIFVVFFIRDWKNIKENVKRVFLLGLVNLLLVFSTGLSNALVFFNSILTIGTAPSIYSNMQNHSIVSYVVWVQSGLTTNITYFSRIMLLIVIICGGLLLARSIFDQLKRNENRIDPLLLMGFSMLTLLLPNENHDYTLAILPIVFSFGLAVAFSASNPLMDGFDLFILSLLYSITLFANNAKPDLGFLQNNCVPILLIFVYITLMMWKKTVTGWLIKPNILTP